MQDDLQRVLLSEQTILSRLDELAVELSSEYQGKELTVVALLNGSVIFMADLLRRMPLPLRLDCLSVSSYHGGTTSSGVVEFDLAGLADLRGRHVLVLDDILDTGNTLAAVQREIRSHCAPLSVKSCVLLSKQRSRDQEVEADYVAFEIADEFVVGYGLDYQEHYRNLPYIGVLDSSVAG